MNISVKEFSFRTPRGSTKGWLYQPSTQIRAVVQISHGMSEHMGRYHDFMRYLARSGYAACGVDHIGHGRTAGDGQFGFFADEEGGKLLLENQYTFYKIIRKELGLPIVMLGHSMGSFVARLFASHYPESLSGLILSGTGRESPFLIPAMLLAQHSVAKNGATYVDKVLSNTVFGAFNRPFVADHPYRGWISRDLEIVRRYCEDQLSNFTFSTSAIRDLLLLIRSANSKACFAHTAKDLPMLFFSGDADPVGEKGVGVRHVYARYAAAGLVDAQMILYEGGRHEMLNEINRKQVYDDVRAWLDDHFIAPDTNSLFDPYEEMEG